MGPRELREEIRAGRFTGTTSGHAPGFAQTNLVVLPSALASDFVEFAERNPKPCPLVEVLEPGDPVPRRSAPDADVRTDLPGYRVFRDGGLAEERRDISDLWSDDAVAILIGCSFTFEEALLDAGVPLRHQEQGVTVPMYRTTLVTEPAGGFAGPTVVSMRPVPEELVELATETSGRYPTMHGAPIQVGDPLEIGIADLGSPDYGDPVEIRAGETPVFWACGVTPQAVAIESRPEWLITHAPGAMFVTDLENGSLELTPDETEPARSPLAGGRCRTGPRRSAARSS